MDQIQVFLRHWCLRHRCLSHLRTGMDTGSVQRCVDYRPLVGMGLLEMEVRRHLLEPRYSPPRQGWSREAHCMATVCTDRHQFRCIRMAPCLQAHQHRLSISGEHLPVPWDSHRRSSSNPPGWRILEHHPRRAYPRLSSNWGRVISPQVRSLARAISHRIRQQWIRFSNTGQLDSRPNISVLCRLRVTRSPDHCNDRSTFSTT